MRKSRSFSYNGAGRIGLTRQRKRSVTYKTATSLGAFQRQTIPRKISKTSNRRRRTWRAESSRAEPARLSGPVSERRRARVHHFRSRREALAVFQPRDPARADVDSHNGGLGYRREISRNRPPRSCVEFPDIAVPVLHSSDKCLSGQHQECLIRCVGISCSFQGRTTDAVCRSESSKIAIVLPNGLDSEMGFAT